MPLPDAGSRPSVVDSWFGIPVRASRSVRFLKTPHGSRPLFAEDLNSRSSCRSRLGTCTSLNSPIRSRRANLFGIPTPKALNHGK